MKRLLIVAAVAAILSGCQSQMAWKYGPEPAASLSGSIEKAVAVPPFDDQRKNENSNKLGMYLIPLMPFGWQEFNTPEGVDEHATSRQWLWRPNEDIAKAAAQEVNNAGLFREVFFTNRASEGDWVLQGRIISTKYDGKVLTYGLSVEGPLLWLLGLPAASVANELVLAFRLEDRATHRTLWEKEYREKVSKTSWIYSLSADFQYPELLKKILLNVVKDIKADQSRIRESAKMASAGSGL
jgi:hypothetical protein